MKLSTFVPLVILGAKLALAIPGVLEVSVNSNITIQPLFPDH